MLTLSLRPLCVQYRSSCRGQPNSVLEFCSLPLRLHFPCVAMYSPIAFREFDPDEYRRFVQTLSDEELVKAGKRLRSYYRSFRPLFDYAMTSIPFSSIFIGNVLSNSALFISIRILLSQPIPHPSCVSMCSFKYALITLTACHISKNASNLKSGFS